jgi:hypothetical protein
MRGVATVRDIGRARVAAFEYIYVIWLERNTIGTHAPV